jgi:uncharacterized membrane protein
MKNETILAMLAYPIFIVSLIWYVLDEDMKKKKECKYHLEQGFILFILWILVTQVTPFIPFIGSVIATIGWLIVVILMVLGIINASKGKKEPLPIIGHFADKVNF